MAGGSKTAVYAAITANSLVTVAKGAGFLLTGSGALLAETVHSLADVGNQALLALGMARAAKPPDADYPLGYAREAFVWSMISAVGIFFLGCGVSVMHGVQALLGDHHAEVVSPTLALGILAFSFVVEGASLVVAVRVSIQHAKERGHGFWSHVRTTDDPFEVAVLLEDSAAVLGVVVAFVAIALSTWTGSHVWDPAGTIAVGVLLGIVATALIAKSRSLLIGRAMGPRQQAVLDAVLEADPAVATVVDRVGVVTGPSSLSIRAELDFKGLYLADQVLADTDLAELHAQLDTPEALRAYLVQYGDDVVDLVGDEVDRLEDKIRRVLPTATRIELEPD